MRIRLFLAVAAIVSSFLLVSPQNSLADAASARTQINAVCTEIDARAEEIKSLTHAKNLEQAFDKLEELNDYIENNLQTAFYDKVQEVRREDPSYTPPQINIDLGVQFTSEYWDDLIQTAADSLQNAEDGLKGIPAMRTLDFQDKSFAVLKGVKNTFQNVGSVIKDAMSVDAPGLIKDAWEGMNQFIEDYTAVENANLQSLNTDLFKSEVELLIKKAKKNLALMKDAKSRFIVFRSEIEQFNLHLKNIAHYSHRAASDPIWPLDFSNTDYIFDAAPYQNALDALSADFAAEEFCWSEFNKIYNGIMAEALAEKNQVVNNINDSGEPQENKNVYLNDVSANWTWLSNYAQTMLDGYNAARAQAVADHDALQAVLDGLEAQINASAESYWDKSGFPSEDLDVFDEQALGIVQTNLPGFSGPSPYYLTREYDPAFPLSESVYSYEMPSQTPDINDYTFRTYPESLEKLAKAYQVMAEAGLETNSERIYSGSGSPVAHFALSPLTQDLMDMVWDNVEALETQAANYAAFMEGKHGLLTDIEDKKTAWDAAVQALADHADANWMHLCTSGDDEWGGAQQTWDATHFDVYMADLDYDFGATMAQRAVESADDYLQGQSDFNQDLAAADELLNRMKNDATLRTMVQFIVSDYTSLPAFPSEQGYLDFLKELEYVAAFYNLSDMERVMDIRSDAKALFQQIFANPSSLNGWMQQRNPYCVMPENEETLQDLIDQAGLYNDLYMANVREGFAGWAAWARQQLQLYWPETSGDDIRPSLVHHTPGLNSEGVSVYQTIRAVFNEAMDASTLVSPNAIIQANGVSKPFTGRYDEATKTFYMYPGSLLPGTVYTVTFGEGCTDQAGNPLVEKSWSFTTESFAAGTLPPTIEITGVEDGAAYTDPVTIGIQVSAGPYQAALWRNGEAPQSIIDGAQVSARGRYDLLVKADQGGSRSLSFTIGAPVEDAAMDIAQEYAAPALPRTISSSEYVAVGMRYKVMGMHYYYISGGKIYLFNLLTGEDSLLFDAGYYYITEGGVNADPTTYCSFLDISEPWVLYPENTGGEAPGMDPADKTFSLFLYNTEDGTTTPVPTGSASVTSGFIHGNTVVWIDFSGADPVIRLWEAGSPQPVDLHTLTGLEDWQDPVLSGFDGNHAVFEISDGGDYVTTDTDGEDGPDYRVPKGESLHSLDVRTLALTDLVSRDPDNPVRVDKAAVVYGRAVALVYTMHGTINGMFWENTCDSSKLLVYHLDAGATFTVSMQPQVWPFQISESLVYFQERINAPPYNMSAAQQSADMIPTAYDLLTHRTYPVDLGSTSGHFQLFGDYLVSYDDTPRIVALGAGTSAVTVTDKTPAEGAVDVSTTADITVSFSGPMDPAALTNEWIALTRVDADGNFMARDPVTISYDSDADVLTLNPGQLVSAANYRVHIAGQVLDATGAALGVPVYWGFSTEDVDGPIFTGSIPESGSKALPPGGAVKLLFNEAVDDDTAQAGVTLLQGAASVPFSAYADNAGVLTITPSSALTASTTYTVEMDGDLTDTAGNGLSANSVITFTTMAVTPLNVSGTLDYADAMMGGIYEITMPDGNSVQLSSSAQDVVSSPDGSCLYFMSGNLQVWNRQTQALTTVDNSFPSRFTPDFTSNGARIIYARNRDGLVGQEIISNSLAGDDPQVLVTVLDGDVTSLELSPDGAKIAYALNISFSDPTQVRVFTFATQEEEVYVGGDAPCWSPDGSVIYAFAKSSDTNNQKAIVSLTPNMAFVEKICGVDSHASPALSPSGNFLAFFTDNGLSLASLTTGNQELVMACSQPNMGTIRLFWTADESGIVTPAWGVESSNHVGAYAVNLGARSVSVITSVNGGMPAMPMDFRETGGQSAPAPVVIQVSNTSTGGVPSAALDWSSYSDGLAASFKVYSAPQPFFTVDGMTPLAIQQATTFVDSQAQFGEPVYYAVTPVTGAGAERKLVEPFGPVILDDQDGLNDAWERLYFNSLAQAGTDDPDNDGLSNAEEAVLGTNPTLKDTDGDLAPDGEEIARGMNPLVKDVAPIVLTAPSADLAVEQSMDLTVSGGSGAYTFSSDDGAVAAVNAQGRVSGLTAGTANLKAEDAVFTGLESNSVGLNVVSNLFGIYPPGPYVMQKNGYLDLKAEGGSGFYSWSLSDETLASLSELGSQCRATSLGELGTFTITVSDDLETERDPDTAEVTVEEIPGDLNGDSLVTLEDAILAVQVVSGYDPASGVNLSGDANNDGAADMRDALFVLQHVQ
ncbi:Ig-like domain (group 2) [Desulfatibacillum alkenivorans DSM 16219]|jgi:hypothetical protein|uniref:Ig-like domain (Group 2) n=1 Tax=Desulfatibacillum alkenivorans DSM 16219 TaxID=1121393 RepID=A0A1M6UWE7_9BACT|nr:Ig-like domain-containing protein [Desulfatibacillum alkenivorans]SHK73508.1 Ig-like domain (group 2) [Desulfatibacillum alkenivorans DSM 16219]